MRVLMAATGDFAVPTFQALMPGRHEVVELITQPDRPAGRGRKLTHSRVKELALEHGVAVCQPERIAESEIVAHIAELAPEVLLVIAYGQKIPQEICSLPPKGAINMHGSLLPELRGAAPCNWAIIRGLKETGVTVQFLAQKMDAGDILAAARVGIGPRETAPELHDRLAVLGVDLVLQTLDELDAGTAAPQAQDESRVTLAPRLDKSDGLIDWTLSAGRIDGMVRGMKPWPGAYTFLCHPGKPELRVMITEAVPHPQPVGDGAPAPGIVAEAGRRLTIATGDGLLEITELKPASSRAMTAEAFCNGHQVEAGDNFGGPDACSVRLSDGGER